jgi:ribose 1,5-bisphosphokinase
VKKNYPGTLFLVVGNSGSGKDSIIYGVSNKYPSNLTQLHIVKRYITRPPSETELNNPITVDEFKNLEEQEKFALKWHIYRLDYGVPIEIDNWLKEGHPVIVNVSRTIVKEANERYGNIKTIFVDVPFEITLQRVQERGRESGDLLDERIERARKSQKFPKADFIVDNSGKLEDAINQLLNYVIKVIKESGNIRKIE